MLRRLLHKIVPPENSLPLAITGLMNLIAFSGPKLLQVLGWSLPMHDMTAAFDRAFPFSPVWVFVYVAAFPFWIYQYSVVAKESRSLCYRLVAADFAAKVICLLFFVLLPTHNVRPPLETGGFTGWAMRTIWLLDTPTNLFPSIHCFVSWLGTRYIYECRSLRHRGLTCTLCTVVRGYDENSGILESDWYNAQVELLRLGSEIWGNGLVQIEAGVFSLMRWYEYTITLEPGQTLKNAVTAPLYPAIDADYTPSIYAYTYLLSPAKTWTQFGELDITVNTPYYMTECGIDGFTRTDGGYALTLPGLPEGELTFTLSEAERPQPPKRSILHLVPTELIIVPAAVLVAVAAVFLPARRKRRTKR